MKCRLDDAGVVEAPEEFIDLVLRAEGPWWVNGQRTWEVELIPEMLGKQGVSAGAQRALRRA